MGYTLLRDQSPSIGIPFALDRHRVHVEQIGQGHVTEGSAHACSNSCDWWFNHGDQVELGAVPDPGAKFLAWNGACAGQGPNCALRVIGDVSTTAVFGTAAASSPPGPSTSTTTTTVTMTTTMTTPAPRAPDAPAADKTVEAQVIAARAVRSRLGARVLEVEVDAHEQLSAILEVREGGKRVWARSIAKIYDTRSVYTILLPRRVRRGPAALALSMRDGSGNTRTWRGNVIVPATK
jgi:hypothetical protein